jgi:peptide/nickel transport system substrate-binding protein
VPYWALPQIRSNPKLKLAYRPKLMTMFFGLDQGSAELRSSNIKGRNPFKDRRVRQAIAYAMDMKSALHELMSELFIPAGIIAARGSTATFPNWIGPRSVTPRDQLP